MAGTGRYSLLQSFAEHRQALTRFLTGRLGNPALAQDLAHQTWIRAATSAGGVILGTPRSHLFRIAANLAIDHQRYVEQRMRLRATEEGVVVAGAQPLPPSSHNVVLHRSELARLARVIDGLTPRGREILLLCRFEGLSHAEVAERLGLSRISVISHMMNAMVALEREIDRPEEKSRKCGQPICLSPSDR